MEWDPVVCVAAFAAMGLDEFLLGEFLKKEIHFRCFPFPLCELVVHFIVVVSCFVLFLQERCCCC